ncbi:protein shisa-5-like [Haliotis rubra]|uniref:protein shisa-5-like n=1 Tax=Haliotis rubra TaxID=36100 RepID=UPI001EE5289B|nr:protein shisa-5-like [Haliotis rubra]
MNIHCFVGVSVLLFRHLVSAHDGSHCNSNGTTFMCSYGCCGDSSHQYCCSSGNNAETTATVALIIGIVCSAVLTVVVIVGLVMCCVRCCCRASKGHQGQLVTTGHLLAVLPTNGPNTTPGAYAAGYVYAPQPAPGTHYTQPAGTAQPPPSYPPGPVPAYPTETGQAKATPEGART